MFISPMLTVIDQARQMIKENMIKRRV